MNNNTHCQGGTMQNITQDIGLGFISPRPRARLDTFIRDALAATKKEQKNTKYLSIPVQNTQNTSYIIYIMNNLKLKK